MANLTFGNALHCFILEPQSNAIKCAFFKTGRQNKMLEASPEGLTVSHHRYQPQDTQKDNQNYKTACLINALTLVHDLLMHF